MQISLSNEGIIGGSVNVGEPSAEQWFLDEAEWLRFTGLKDKNCVEIYEGDVVIVNSPFDWIYGWKFVVRWCETLCTFYLYRQDQLETGLLGEKLNYYKAENKFYEVIGNIYANPELLEARE